MACDTIKYLVTTPSKNLHTVIYEDEKWYGLISLLFYETPDFDVKWYLARKLKQLMLIEVEGKWGGYEWIPID